MVFDYNSQVQAMANTGMFQQYTPMMNYMYAQQTNGLQVGVVYTVSIDFKMTPPLDLSRINVFAAQIMGLLCQKTIRLIMR